MSTDLFSNPQQKQPYEAGSTGQSEDLGLSLSTPTSKKDPSVPGANTCQINPITALAHFIPVLVLEVAILLMSEQMQRG